ncbi:MAG: hypothetical protein ACREM3_19875 [Candidatus Rokuibacteriota bacterium]
MTLAGRRWATAISSAAPGQLPAIDVQQSLVGRILSGRSGPTPSRRTRREIGWRRESKKQNRHHEGKILPNASGRYFH